MNIEPTTLYMKDASGAMRVWSIGVEDWDIIIDYGILGGSIQKKFERVPEGKAGRTRKDQIILQMASRISRRRDQGYVSDIEEANEMPVNSMGLAKPMLAQPWKNVKEIDYSNAFIQRKYDGHRCLVTRKNGDLIAYSRNGKPITTINHILKNIHIEEGQTLDGELYYHGVPLQTISSWVKKQQQKSLALSYIVYDAISEDKFEERIKLADESINECLETFIADTVRIKSSDIIDEYYRRFKSEGYEGAIVRHGAWGYAAGPRHKQLVKVKGTFDGVFMAIDITPSADGWAIVECLMDSGYTFRVSAPGNMAEKTRILNEKSSYIGKMLRVEYANLTKDGIPFHPIATNWL